MGSVKPEVYASRWLRVDTSSGDYIIAQEVVALSTTRLAEIQTRLELEKNHKLTIADLLPELADYCESRDADVYSVDEESGWLARLTTPGYMDSTYWLTADTEQGAREALCDMYGACGDDSDECFCGRCKRWSVVVGNVGTIYEGLDEDEARGRYKQAVLSASDPRGLDGGEPVTLFRGEEIEEETAGTNPTE